MLLSAGIGAFLLHNSIPGRNMPSNRQVPGIISPIFSGEIQNGSSSPLFAASNGPFSYSSPPPFPPLPRLSGQGSPAPHNPSYFLTCVPPLFSPHFDRTVFDITMFMCDQNGSRINLSQKGDPNRYGQSSFQAHPVALQSSRKGGLVVVVVEIID